MDDIDKIDEPLQKQYLNAYADSDSILNHDELYARYFHSIYGLKAGETFKSWYEARGWKLID